MSSETKKQTIEKNERELMRELTVYQHDARPSWKIAELHARTFVCGQWIDIKAAETSIPASYDRAKRATTKEVHLILDREAATALRDILNVMLGDKAVRDE